MKLPDGCHVTLFPLADIVMCKIKPMGSYSEREVSFHADNAEAALEGAVKLYQALPQPQRVMKITLPQVKVPCTPQITVALPTLSR